MAKTDVPVSMTPLTIRKILSPNDTGETGGNQAGILIPKKQRILSFFPALRTSERNPRAHIVFKDHAGQQWEFAFIYYNNRRFGGTRDEYRLTRMTEYIRRWKLSTGDEIILDRDVRGGYAVRHEFAPEHSAEDEEWKVIDLQ